MSEPVASILDWAADAVQRYPPWVVVGLLSGGVLYLAWRQLEAGWRHAREIETERLRHRIELERDWLVEALHAEDPEHLLRIAHALGLGTTDRGQGEGDRPVRQERITGGGSVRAAAQMVPAAKTPPAGGADPLAGDVGGVGGAGDGGDRGDQGGGK